ncbi:MAG: RICIN domain-containing protein [Faecalibacillus intestinalis]|uniref:RICIN domain-containing protein n=1 Tax=Faecalibacillus intestinalis TaxID=1982626 RepID=UPI0026EBE72B|nr:RICIN domain-containing protein [Ruminococcus bromii]
MKRKIISMLVSVSMVLTIFTFSSAISVNASSQSNNWSWPTYVHSIKSDWPNYSSGSYHAGTDFPVPLNTPVYSTCDGEVVAVTSLTTSYGKHIKIRATVNGSTVYIRYCHLNSFAVNVGDKVTSGQLIAYSGSTGNSTGPHLHYEVRNSNDRYGSSSNPNLNPRDYLPGTSYLFTSDKSTDVPSITIPSGSQTVSDGEYHIVSALDNNMGLDVEAASSDLCANIQLYNNVLDDSQVFVVNYLGDGYYKITNKHSGKSLDVANGGMKSGTNVWQYDYTGDNAQKWIIKESGDGKYFNIVSAKNGLYLDVDGGIAENCRNIRTYSYNNTNAQKWKFVAFGNSIGRTLSNGDYHIVTVLDESKGLDVYGGYKENGTNVDIYSNLQDESQVFTVTYKGNGYYSIINKYSNKSLDCQNGNTVSGTNVQTYEYDNVDQKQWIIKESGDGQSFNIISKNSGLYLDVKSGDSANYSNVQVHIGNNTNAQKWKFVAYNNPKNSSIKDGNYHIVSKLNKNFGLDVAGALDDDAINVRLYNNIYDSNQVFNVVYLNDGYYKITNVKTGKSLDVASASAYKGANLQQYTYKDVNQQKWIIEDSGDNKNYYISSKNAGLYLTSESTDIENGTNVFLTINDYSDRQQWEFTLSNLNGDIDLDNSVTVADATLLQKYVVGIATLTDDQKLLADCNGDGAVDVRDATYIQKTIVKIPV